MGDGLSVSMVGDTELIAELERAQLLAVPESRALVSKGALNIKGDWRRAWSDISHAPFVSLAISYDVTVRRADIEGEIGPEDSADRQGFLGAVFELGGLHSPPIPGGIPALDREAPRFEAAIVDLSKRLLP
jgi:hypothetical protein